LSVRDEETPEGPFGSASVGLAPPEALKAGTGNDFLKPLRQGAGRSPPARDSTMSGLQILGFAAALLTTLCWLPQALRTIRTKDTQSLSLATQGAFTLGVALWLVYGIMSGNAPIIFANGITFFLVALILALKLRYG
jgi:MtN3 and saliva related transmembrane protein